jgi:hypothetical protein
MHSLTIIRNLGLEIVVILYLTSEHITLGES